MCVRSDLDPIDQPPSAPRMSSGDKRPSGALNVVRRTWDREEYEVKAKERAEREASGQLDEEDGKGRGKGRVLNTAEPFRSADADAAGPDGSRRAFLSARTEELSLEANLNKRKLVTEATPTGAHGGYYCDVCECTLKDSTAYLDHINGKRHQRKLGFSMRVEKSSLDAVRARLAAAKSAQSNAHARSVDTEESRREALSEYESRVEENEEAERRRKRARKDKGSSGEDAARPVPSSSTGALGSHMRAGPGAVSAQASGQAEGGGEDAEVEMAKIMGFAGFS